MAATFAGNRLESGVHTEEGEFETKLENIQIALPLKMEC